MIVDKSQFQELIKRKVNEAVSRFEMERKAKGDERIFQVVEKLDGDKLAIARFLKFLIDSENEKMSKAIEEAFEEEEKGVPSFTSLLLPSSFLLPPSSFFLPPSSFLLPPNATEEVGDENKRRERRVQRKTHLEEALKTQKSSFLRSLEGPVFRPSSDCEDEEPDTTTTTSS
jgi:hypothetical protein